MFCGGEESGELSFYSGFIGERFDSSNSHINRRKLYLPVLSEGFTNDSPQPVSVNGSRDGAFPDNDTEARGTSAFGEASHLPSALDDFSAVSCRSRIFGPSGQKDAGQTESRLRPLRRRALRIARPWRVAIRERKPCRRFRRMFEG